MADTYKIREGMMSRALLLIASAVEFAALAIPVRASADPIELSCNIGGRPQAVFVIDMAKATGMWVNANQVFEGKLDIEDTYVLCKLTGMESKGVRGSE